MSIVSVLPKLCLMSESELGAWVFSETERACILSKAELGACVLSEKRVWTAIILFLLFVIFCNRIFSINELSANEILYIESIIERIQ